MSVKEKRLPGPKPRAPHPWALTLSSRTHKKVGVLLLRHCKSQLCYVSVAKNVHHRAQTISGKLRTGTFSNNRVQQLFQEDPHFELEIQVFDQPGKTFQELNQAALEAAAALREQLGERCCNSLTSYMHTDSRTLVRDEIKPHHYNCDYRGVVPFRLLDQVWFNPQL